MNRTRNINIDAKSTQSNRRPVPRSYEELFSKIYVCRESVERFLRFLNSLCLTEGVYLFGLKYTNKIPPKSSRLIFGQKPLNISMVRQKSISTSIVDGVLTTKLFYSLTQQDMEFFKEELSQILSWNDFSDIVTFDAFSEILKISSKINIASDFFAYDSPSIITGPRSVRILKIDSVLSKLKETGILTVVNFDEALNIAYLNPAQYNYLIVHYPSIIVDVLEVSELSIDYSDELLDKLDEDIALPALIGNETTIGVIDAGCELPSVFTPYIDGMYDIRESPSSRDLFHGTAVSSLIIAHDQINASDPDGLGNFKVRHFELFKQRNDPTSYFYLKSTIESTVRNNSDIKVWNLSFGGIKRPYDVNISEMGVMLDVLSAKYGVLFIIASGNWRDRVPNWTESLNFPGDSLNALTVGSVEKIPTYTYQPSIYSSFGPILHFEKPEVSSFGGPNNSNNTPLALLSDTGVVYGKQGTSFSAPKVTRMIAFYVSQGYTPYEAKAKVISNAIPEIRQRRKESFPGWKSAAYGVTEIPDNTFDLKLTISLSGKKPVYFPVEFPNGVTEVKITGCFVAKPNPNLGEEYSVSNLELGLIWHEDIRYPEFHKKSRSVEKDIITDIKTYGTEIYQRFENGKWFPTTKVSSSISSIARAKQLIIDEVGIANPILSLRIRKQDLFETDEEQTISASIVITVKGNFNFDEFEEMNTQLIVQEIEQDIEVNS